MRSAIKWLPSLREDPAEPHSLPLGPRESVEDKPPCGAGCLSEVSAHDLHDERIGDKPPAGHVPLHAPAQPALAGHLLPENLPR